MTIQATIQVWIGGLLDGKHATEWIVGLTGAGAAMLGSIVSVTWTEAFNRRTRRRDQKARNAAGAFAAYQRLNQIYSTTMVVKRHLDKSFAEARKIGAEQLCAVVQPLNRLPGPIVFPLDELWTLFQVGGKELINQVASLDHSYNSVAEAMEEYRRLRDEVWHRLPPAEMDGIVGTIDMTFEKKRELQPYFAALDSMLTQIVPIVNALVADSFEGFRQLIQAKSKPLGKGFEIGFSQPDGTIVKIRASPPRKKWFAWGKSRNPT